MASAAPVWNLANGVTVARIALVPVVAVALLLDDGSGAWRWVAAGCFALAAATDRLDGWLARRLDQVTDWGKLVDPIADKLLIGTSLVLLSWLGDLPWWITVVVLVRELGITAMRFAVLRYVVIPASPGGKLKTVLQSVGIGIFLLPLDRLPAALGVVGWVVLLAAVAVTVVTGADYVRRGWQVRSAAARDAGHDATPPSADGDVGGEASTGGAAGPR
ncbi:CDP-diacylglycerol--glycerol-3-phosphate 3-phosphatidyltransferase [Cellulomonas carbonis]|uniref:CDP-diacylglycerol--glycerol-3-phosphate 3-phosphatidyltransferase n=1 Tax=Cellulomonas carbonis T26 TaxID=947969 RepID=A0A0A0BWV6_9CELL|nr:CDP-diacylglycerol--glycerol-3-phosphate 3-phosphatidyltransferase [Cellulomonas carbonis]KGM12157.1 CDP-diacylglycerol--glycerol-3-phosphate 3-phosphatidyltransferase [Cellulomonas carbonis T26]GGB97499.1 CDP-diacylglycerol--glycerol-3-phosphate 3-phosphatidyltransferase [Cellulomonas carbonis]